MMFDQDSKLLTSFSQHLHSLRTFGHDDGARPQWFCNSSDGPRWNVKIRISDGASWANLDEAFAVQLQQARGQQLSPFATGTSICKLLVGHHIQGLPVFDVHSLEVGSEF